MIKKEKNSEFLLEEQKMLLCIAIWGVLSTTGKQVVQANILPEFKFTYSTQLDQEGNYVLLWEPREKEILLEVQVKTLGYIGFGFSHNGAMDGADIVIGWVSDDNVGVLTDRHGIGYDTPSVDESQDYKLLGNHANATHTLLRFSRPWVTCDLQQDFNLTDDTTRVIWAYSSIKPDDVMDEKMVYHEHRGVKSLLLKEPSLKLPMASDGVRFWNVTGPEVHLPDNLDTLYWCKLFKAPELGKKYHYIGFEPIIEKRNLRYVHHILLYECDLPNSREYMEKWIGEKGAQCYTNDAPVSWQSCNKPLLVWAIGSEGTMLPDEVGFPIHEKYGGATYFLLEIHYNNNLFEKGIVDSSGVKIFLTDKLRPYDGGLLMLGRHVNPWMVIPPQSRWQIKGYCASECSEQTFPKDGIQVFGALLHTHLLGTAVSTTHIRGGVELEPLVTDYNYDSNYQRERVLKRKRTVLPGDELITTCTYDATQKNESTFGGLGISQEMCIVFLAYYPRVNLINCISMPPVDAVIETLGIEEIYNPLWIPFKMLPLSGNHIVTDEDERKLKIMQETPQAGSKSVDFELKNILRLISVSKPESMSGVSLFDILNRNSTWQDANMVAALDESMNQMHQVFCDTREGHTIEGINEIRQPPAFAPYTRNPPSCSG